MFENRVHRRTFGPKREGLTGEWQRLHNEELNDLYSSPNVTQVIQSRRKRWEEHVAHMGGGEVHIRFCWGNGKRPLGKPGVDGTVILK